MRLRCSGVRTLSSLPAPVLGALPPQHGAPRRLSPRGRPVFRPTVGRSPPSRAIAYSRNDVSHQIPSPALRFQLSFSRVSTRPSHSTPHRNDPAGVAALVSPAPSRAPASRWRRSALRLAADPLITTDRALHHKRPILVWILDMGPGSGARIAASSSSTCPARTLSRRRPASLAGSHHIPSQAAPLHRRNAVSAATLPPRTTCTMAGIVYAQPLPSAFPRAGLAQSADQEAAEGTAIRLHRPAAGHHRRTPSFARTPPSMKSRLPLDGPVHHRLNASRLR